MLLSFSIGTFFTNYFPKNILDLEALYFKHKLPHQESQHLSYFNNSLCQASAASKYFKFLDQEPDKLLVHTCSMGSGWPEFSKTKFLRSRPILVWYSYNVSGTASLHLGQVPEIKKIV